MFGRCLHCVIAGCLLMLSAAWAGELDIRAIAAKLERQEALVRDLEAKAGLEYVMPAEGITSIQKNAAVTIGGYTSTAYSFNKTDTKIKELGSMVPDRRYRIASLEVADADLTVAIEVSEHFDAFLKINLYEADQADVYGAAEQYWIRWKNIANTGFGLKVGRDELVFGAKGYGYLRTWTQSMPQWQRTAVTDHNQWYVEGVNQVTPYWEGLDGRFKAELSFMVNTRGNQSYNYYPLLLENDDGSRRRGRDYGLRTISLRLNYEPVEGLRLTASAANFYRRHGDWRKTNIAFPLVKSMYRDNNLALGLAASYRPAFLRQLNLWTQWVYGKNVLNLKGKDSNVVNAGLSWDFTDRLTVFAQGEYFKVKDFFSDYPIPAGNHDRRFRGLAGYVGAIYNFGHGVTLEAGYRRDRMSIFLNEPPGYIGKRYVHDSDIFYTVLGFEF